MTKLVNTALRLFGPLRISNPYVMSSIDNDYFEDWMLRLLSRLEYIEKLIQHGCEHVGGRIQTPFTGHSEQRQIVGQFRLVQYAESEQTDFAALPFYRRAAPIRYFGIRHCIRRAMSDDSWRLISTGLGI